MRNGLRRAAVAGASQAVSSVQNFAALSFIAQASSATSFGRVSLLVAVQVGAVGVGQALFGQPFIILYSDRIEGFAREAHRVLNGATLYSILVSAVAAVVAVFAAGEWRNLLLAFAIGFPALHLQEQFRAVLFARGETNTALASDLTWVAAWGAALAVAGDHGAIALYSIWLTSAVFGVLVGAGRMRIWFRPSSSDLRWWFGQTKEMRGPLVFEYLTVNGTNQLATLGVGGLIGLAPSGGLRAGQAIVGPINTALTALSMLTLPELVRAGGATNGRGRRLTSILTLVATVGALISVPIVLYLGSRWGSALFGSSWQYAAPIVFLLLLQRVAMGLGMGAGTALLADRHARRSASARSIGAVCGLLMTTVGAWRGGLVGSCYGLLLGSLLTSALLVAARRSVLKAHVNGDAKEGSDLMKPSALPVPGGEHP
ncbi:hypothetical protein [Cryptosporangium sp. NPDC048952]|uniref:hypothetical protein n=1 Tax=Cryptosporangium sp. NPDC048952 TaxID=3363961 RepID=UPI0037104FD3